MEFYELMEGIDYQGFSVGTEIIDVVCDSRKVKPGVVFVAIRGNQTDGHDKVVEALQAGAAFVVVEKDMGIPLQIVVENTHKAYALLCANLNGRPADKLHLIGVTGTNGKTTVTTVIYQLLTAMKKKVGLIGTIENRIGEMVIPARYTTPDAASLQVMLNRMVNAGCTHAVIEVSSHAMEQHRLEGCVFDIGVFTNLTQDHLDYHKTMENYYEAKAKLARQSKKMLINIDDDYGHRFYNDCQNKGILVKSYGFSSSADYCAENLLEQATGVSFDLLVEDQKINSYFPMPGKFSAQNALAAVGSLYEEGFDLFDIIEKLKNVDGVKGRSEIISKELNLPFTVIRDYAHSPDGLEKILSTYRSFVKNRLIVVFGAPGERDSKKRAIMGEVVSKYSDFAIITSDNPRGEDEQSIIEQVEKGLKDNKIPYETYTDRYQAIKRAIEIASDGDLILLAGKGHEEYQVLSYGTIVFDEKKLLKEMISKEV